jgi:photosystem II stability/assembly factor-like uncharacterized protein
MTETLYRYPGAQPFRDDEFSRRTFFGREPASIALTDQILANRLVIVYAKSGLGKTSLLNAGVAPRLRDAGNLPLFVRVNDIERGPLHSVFEGVRAEAERQQVEYVPGDSSSLWSFFKTVEFWRGDLLLTPVLIIDQFEELFTLQSEGAREAFLSELSYLVRGVPPPSESETESKLDEAPPAIRLVLSLREDFLGLLEEASDHIPEIMDHRYRLAPLSYEMASEAITRPAAIEHSKIATKVFSLEPSLVTSILDYLTRSATGAQAKQHVEPFHLQLICQRIEKVAALRQQATNGEVVLSFKDIGGEPALADTLESFYSDAIRSLPGRHLRSAARMLCEQFLISPEGRRLSVEGRELRLQLKLPPEILNDLVERRLLRTDRRSDSTYYELSHDALVQPVLEGRRVQALVVGGVAVLAGAVCLLAAALLLLIVVFGLFSDKHLDNSTILGIGVIGACAVFLGFQGNKWLKSGLRRRRRYRRHVPADLNRSLPTLRPLRDRVLGWAMALTGMPLFILWGVVGFFGLLLFTILLFAHGAVPHWLSWMENDLHPEWQLLYQHPYMEMQWWGVEYLAVVAFGWFLFRQGSRKLWPHRFAARPGGLRIPGTDHWPPALRAVTAALCGVVMLVVAASGFLALRTCAAGWRGGRPNWINWGMVSYRFVDVCEMTYQKKLSWDEVTLGLAALSAFVFSIVLLHSGIVELAALLRERRLSMSKEEQKRFTFAAVGCVVLIVGALALTVHSILWRVRAGRVQMRQAQAALASHDAGPLRLGWAVGDYSEILHTEDGITWTGQNRGDRGYFNSVAFPTSQYGWAVGSAGTIWHTDNGGANWNVQSSNETQSLGVIAAVGPRLGWAAGRGGPVVHTEDDGGNWKPQYKGDPKMDPTIRVSAAAFVTPQSGWGVGSIGTILHTEDGGSTWKKQSSGTSDYLNFVAFATPQSGWVVGDNGLILHTDDGGTNWKPQTSGTIRDLLGIAFATPSSGWIVGKTGTILHTEDAGRTWVAQDSGSRMDLLETAFITPQTGWVVGYGGTILHTEDEGKTWVQQVSGIRTNLHSVAFVRPFSIIGVVESDPKPAAAGAKVAAPRGVLLLSVGAGSPADKAGLKAGDYIAAVNGRPVKTVDESVAEVSVLKPGTEAEVTYIRDHKEQTVQVITADGSMAGAPH